MSMIYGDGTNSSIEQTGKEQLSSFYFEKKAVIDAQEDMYLQKLSGTTDMPKHFGQTIKKYRYIPLLDDENVNSQGLDVTGNAIPEGNLYGSSRDVGTIISKLPDLREEGGRVNRVGFQRKQIEGSIQNRGFFFEWSKDAMQFDSDKDMKMHITREAVKGATQLNEDILYIDLINNAGVTYFAGNATSVATISGEVDDDTAAVVSYDDLMQIDVELTNNRCPRDTKVIAGSRLIDTKTVRSARYMFISPDVEINFRSMVDFFGKPAFEDVKNYSDANSDTKYVKALAGEIGAVGPFRIIVHPKAVMRSGAGAAVVNNAAGLRNDGSNYDVYPCLVVGSEAFTHIGFEYGAGTKSKFKIKTKNPEENYSQTDPYGKMGFTSIEFWNGIIVDRPEWIAVYNVGARL